MLDFMTTVGGATSICIQDTTKAYQKHLYSTEAYIHVYAVDQLLLMKQMTGNR